MWFLLELYLSLKSMDANRNITPAPSLVPVAALDLSLEYWYAFVGVCNGVNIYSGDWSLYIFRCITEAGNKEFVALHIIYNYGRHNNERQHQI